ncbi:MAG: GNAT family N-acetyltransferase [Flavobacteriaceae bacterium]
MLVLREPKASDAGTIARLHAKSWQQNYRGALSDSFLDHEVFAERSGVWTKRFEVVNPKQLITVAEHNGAMAGFGCAYLGDHPKYGALLDNLHVVSKAQGLGIGSKLMADLARKCAAHDPDSGMYLWVLQQNRKAIDFYAALGGEKMETVVGNDIGDREILKCRYVWPSVAVLYKQLNAKQKAHER